MDYLKDFPEIERDARHVFEVMAPRVSAEELDMIKRAYEFARDAHKDQRRKSGHPYIIHPVAVALIAADELKLDAASVATAFLHDVVEDTDHSLAEIEHRFGPDVAFLVDIVTKKKKSKYQSSKQVDNFRQLLDSCRADIRALMVKLADRLHNMRTLASMRPDKRMKIAGETDYFYAPLANRLGLFDVKTDLENLSFKYRCSLEYEDIEREIKADIDANRERVETFIREINEIHCANGIYGEARPYYRRPYSIWRRMKAGNVDFKHVENRYYVRVTFTGSARPLSEKDLCLRIYSLLTDRFKEKPNSFLNQIDQAKENSYKCIRVMLLSDGGIWEDVQICSERMVLASKLGPMAEISEHDNVSAWLKRFRLVLDDLANETLGPNYMESIVSTLYYDDIMVFTPDGSAFILPMDASALDLAFELGNETGLHAKYVRINGRIASVKTRLHAGDCVEVFTDDAVKVRPDWIDHVVTYNAKRTIRRMLKKMREEREFTICPHCNPLPGGDVIGFRDEDGNIMMHRRSCRIAIKEASQHGDTIINFDFKESPDKLYPVRVTIRAIDRYHLLLDIIEEITNGLKLPIESLSTSTTDDIADCTVVFFVHSVTELVSALDRLSSIDGVEAVKNDD